MVTQGRSTAASLAQETAAATEALAALDDVTGEGLPMQVSLHTSLV